MHKGEALMETLRDIGAIQVGHFVLASGLHTRMRVGMDELANYPERAQYFLEEIESRALALEIDTIVSVPRGGSRLLAAKQTWAVPVIHPEKVKQCTFRIAPEDQELLAGVSRIAIFDDVVTTGGTPGAMAREVLAARHTPAALHMFGMMRLGEIGSKNAEYFVSQHFLLEEEIPTSSAEVCTYCLAVGAVASQIAPNGIE